MNGDVRALAEPCDAACPVRRTARLIEGKWTTLIIRDLLGGTRRFSELLRSLDGVSPKMLSARLTFLETQGIVAKTIYPCVPPKTEYELTPLGRDLKSVIQAMMAFGEQLPASAGETVVARQGRNG